MLPNWDEQLEGERFIQPSGDYSNNVEEPSDFRTQESETLEDSNDSLEEAEVVVPEEQTQDAPVNLESVESVGNSDSSERLDG